MSERLDLLIFGAHADDAEIGMGGTIKKHVLQGYRVGICDLTRAEMSSNGDVDTRLKEAEAAGEILGLALRKNLGLPDRGLSLCKEHIDAVTIQIRKYKPRAVFAPYWEDRHPDHVACSKLVEEAVFNAKLRRYLPDADPWTVEQVYFYFINGVVQPDVMVDVTAVYPYKVKALETYRSQFIPGENTVMTPLNQEYVERVRARDQLLGQKRTIGCAEGFITRIPFMPDTLL